MTNREFFVARWTAEGPATLRVLGAVPEAKSGYKPEPRSRSAAELVGLLAGETMSLVPLIDRGEFDMRPEGQPPLATLVQGFEQAHAAVADRVAKLDEQRWGKIAKLSYMGHVIFERPLGQILWALLFDCIHHRGQLSTYLRPMGSKVPSIYGPSADEQGAPEAT